MVLSDREFHLVQCQQILYAFGINCIFNFYEWPLSDQKIGHLKRAIQVPKKWSLKARALSDQNCGHLKRAL